MGRLLLPATCVLCVFLCCSVSHAEHACVVATVHPLATDAGVEAFEQGGNAVDAAIAAALTLGVVDSPNSGLGGGCFILIRQPDGTILAIDGREKAPAAATSDMYVRDGEVDPELSTRGPLAVGVPGALAAYALAIEKCGQRKLAELVLPAAEIAEQGFPIDRVYARKLASKAGELAQFAGSRRALLKSDGTAYREGEMLRQADLAESYRRIAELGPAWFYQGEFAEAVGRWMAANGGILTAADFASYEPVERKPLVTTYRDWQIVGFPPPSSGGVHVAQILNILEQFDLGDEYQRDPVCATHITIEAMKLAFADRAYWLGDSDFADVPLGLVDKTYAKTLAKRVQPERISEVASHGNPPHAQEAFFGRHTTHIAAADTAGYWVAITATVNTSFGSKVIVPGTGIVLNNEMDDFSSQPGVPNVFGLIGAENNAIAPGKRPLSSMSPTIVLDAAGKPMMTVGAAGGPKIITQVVLTLIRTFDLGEELSVAVAAPRHHHQWRPDCVLLESATAQNIVEGLRGYGHRIETVGEIGITQAIGRDAEGRLIGVHDPRIPGKVGYGKRSDRE
ncbi:MAG: gamma-glutamyltransferase [Planctomycetes bacterium]|nr:gamma-glutamyltransferase [Planctomycetota bacterium]